MATPFAFSHEFHAPSKAAIFRAYFDPELSAEEDRRVDLVKREIVSLEDDGVVLQRCCRCVPRRQLPSFLRRADSELSYREALTWTRSTDRIELDIRPSMFTTRIHITTLYVLTDIAPGRIERSFSGLIDVTVPLIGGRIERSILDDMKRSLATAAVATQEWLDRHAEGQATAVRS